MEVASESVVDSARRSVWLRAEGRGEVDLRKLLVDAASSTVTTLGLPFNGVPGFDLRAEAVGGSLSLPQSRSILLEPDDGERVFASLIDPPLPSLFFNSSAALCRSDFFRSVLGVGVLT